jgi:TatD DNase family protein
VPWFDTGVNLLDPRFDLHKVLQESYVDNLTDLLIIASDIDESTRGLALASSGPIEGIALHASAGVHPHHADATNSDSWTKLKQLLADKNVRAVGECGLDFNRNFSTQTNQIRAFDAQLQIAVEYQKGVYLHERDAFEQQCKMLLPVHDKLPFLVAHCFTGNEAQMQRYLSFGCYIGITGWVCDDKRGHDLQQAVASLPLDRLLLETDAPYLFPKTVRPRAKQNSPKYIYAIAEKVAQIKNVSVQEIQQAAYYNACKLFKN